MDTATFERKVLELGEAVRTARVAKGLTQFQLAHLAGVSLPTVQRFETGKSDISIELFSRIAHVLELHLRLTAA